MMIKSFFDGLFVLGGWFFISVFFAFLTMSVTILNHCEKENFVCVCVIEDHNESINVDLTSHPPKKVKGWPRILQNQLYIFYTCPVFSIELINPKSFQILIGSFCWAESKIGQVLVPVAIYLIGKLCFFLRKKTYVLKIFSKTEKEGERGNQGKRLIKRRERHSCGLMD